MFYETYVITKEAPYITITRVTIFCVLLWKSYEFISYTSNVYFFEIIFSVLSDLNVRQWFHNALVYLCKLIFSLVHLQVSTIFRFIKLVILFKP